MTLQQLEYIIAVDTYRHFVTAAERCFVTQPTLSMQIQKLEDELGVKIFDRSKQPVKPTEIGGHILKQAREVLRSSEKIKELVFNVKNEISGDLRLGIIPTVSPYLLPLFIRKYNKKYPKVTFHVDEMVTEQITEQIQNGFLDMGVVATPLEDNALEEHPLYYEPFVAYINQKHRLFKKMEIEANDIKIDDIWLLSDGHCFRNHAINLCGADSTYIKPLDLEYRTGSLESLIKLVDHQFGYTLLPYLAVSDLRPEQKGMVRYFKNPVPTREISIITPKGYLKYKLIDSLRETIRENIPGNMQNINNENIVKWK